MILSGSVNSRDRCSNEKCYDETHRYDYECFFFSSRRRHTRLQGDWSSDVCSSDLWIISRAVNSAKAHSSVSRAPRAIESSWISAWLRASGPGDARSCSSISFIKVTPSADFFLRAESQPAKSLPKAATHPPPVPVPKPTPHPA